VGDFFQVIFSRACFRLFFHAPFGSCCREGSGDIPFDSGANFSYIGNSYVTEIGARVLVSSTENVRRPALPVAELQNKSFTSTPSASARALLRNTHFNLGRGP
jgi:hypothetical protein